MDIAFRFAKESSAQRMKVGCVIVKEDRIVSYGWNGMPTGWSNICEDPVYFDNGNISHLVTRPEVLHAESNAIAKLAKNGESSSGATLYTTLSPCLQCAKLIHQCGISRVIYIETYRDTSGIDFLYETSCQWKSEFTIERMEGYNGKG